MNKIKDGIKRNLEEQWEKAANGYICALLNMWNLSGYDGYWIADEVGGIFDYGCGMFTINIHDIIYCVEHDVTQQQYMEWEEYCCNAAEFGFDIPNLKSWMMGCPRTPSETFERFRKMKADLDAAIIAEKHHSKPTTPS